MLNELKTPTNILLLSLVCAVLTLSWSTQRELGPVQDVVRAKRLELIGADGRTTAVLENNSISLFDSDGSACVIVKGDQKAFLTCRSASSEAVLGELMQPAGMIFKITDKNSGASESDGIILGFNPRRKAGVLAIFGDGNLNSLISLDVDRNARKAEGVVCVRTAEPGCVTKVVPDGLFISHRSTNADTGVVKARSCLSVSEADNGGLVTVYNRTGESVVTMRTDEYGNGEVGAWDRKGKGRTLKPGN